MVLAEDLSHGEVDAQPRESPRGEHDRGRVVRSVDDDLPAGPEARPDAPQKRERICDVLEEIHERDDVVRLGRVEIFGAAGAHQQAARTSGLGEPWAQLETLRVEAHLARDSDEAPDAGADVEEPHGLVVRTADPRQYTAEELAGGRAIEIVARRRDGGVAIAVPRGHVDPAGDVLPPHAAVAAATNRARHSRRLPNAAEVVHDARAGRAAQRADGRRLRALGVNHGPGTSSIESDIERGS